MIDGIGGGSHEVGGASHAFSNHSSAFAPHGGAFGRGNNAFGHPFDLGHMAATLGLGNGAGRGGHLPGHASIGHVGRTPGAAHPQAFWTAGFMSHALAAMGVGDAATCNNNNMQGEEIRLPGIIVGDHAVQLLVYPHGFCDVKALFKRMAIRHGMRTLSRRAPGKDGTSKIHETLLDTRLFDGPGAKSIPSGAFTDATGSTNTWTENWQAPSKKHFWSNEDVDLGPPLPPHIAATGHTWSFSQTGDYETRVLIVADNPKTSKAGEWVPLNPESAKRHMIIALKIAMDMYAELTQVKPKEHSVIMRQIQLQAPSRVGTTGAQPEMSCTPADHNNGVGPGPVPQRLRTGNADINAEMAGI